MTKIDLAYSLSYCEDLFLALWFSPLLISLLFFSLPLLQSPDAEASSTTEVDLFMSTQRIKVLNADSQVGTKKNNSSF